MTGYGQAVARSVEPLVRAVTPPFTQWLQPDEAQEWDAFVAQHPLGLVYHLTAWKKVLESAFPHIRGRFLALREAGTARIVAGLPVYTVRSWLLGNRVVSVPFASLCDPLVSSAAELQQLLLPIGEILRQDARRLEIRTTKTTHLLGPPSFPPSSYRHHYLPLNRTPEELFRSFAKTSIRDTVRKAAKAGIQVVEAKGRQAVELSHAILSETRLRLSLPPMPVSFFEAMSVHLPERLKIFFALQNGKPVACHLVLADERLWISEHQGNTRGASAGANQILCWEIIQRAHAAGAKIFSFGRTSAGNQGLLVYKRRWSTVEENLGDFVLRPDALTLSLPELAQPREITPSYRIVRYLSSGKSPQILRTRVGNFCYRHLG